MFVFNPLANSFVKGEEDEIIKRAVLVAMVNDGCPARANPTPVNLFPVV